MTKFLLIYHLPDGESNLLAYCNTEKEARFIISDWIADGRNPDEMEVVKVKESSKVKIRKEK